MSPVAAIVGPARPEAGKLDRVARLVKSPDSVLTLSCMGCTASSTAQLALQCDESPGAVPVAVSPQSSEAVPLILGASKDLKRSQKCHKIDEIRSSFYIFSVLIVEM